MLLKQVSLLTRDVIVVQSMLAAQVVHICLQALEIDADQG